MRQPTRPFITAYKSRSSKSRSSDSSKVKEVENASADPSLNDLSALATLELAPDAAYLAALKAADAVFGREADELPRTPSQSIQLPAGRVLPDLLQDDVVSSRPGSAASKKTRRERQAATTKEPVHTKLKKPKRQVIMVTPTRSIPPGRERDPEIVPDTSSRARRTIQEKWVLKTGLKAGERWKRRLGKFAR